MITVFLEQNKWFNVDLHMEGILKGFSSFGLKGQKIKKGACAPFCTLWTFLLMIHP